MISNMKLSTFLRYQTLAGLMLFVTVRSVFSGISLESLVSDDAAYTHCLDKNFCLLSTQDCTTSQPLSEFYAYLFGYDTSEDPSDTCSCGCDDTCHANNACCEDVYNPSKIPPVNQECIQYDRELFYAVTTCPEEYTVAAIKTLCHNPITFRSRNFIAPDETEWFVYSSQTRYTYRNFYCALCNSETYDNLIFWPLTIACETDDAEDGSGTDTTAVSEEPVDTEKCYKYLTSQNTVRCPTLFVGTCPLNYPDRDTVDKCEFGPMAIIEATNASKRFRNLHCMICNGVKSDITCYLTWRDPGPFDDLGELSLALLVHPFNPQCEGVGDGIESICSQMDAEFGSCGMGQMYSLRKKSCENLCPQPLVWQNGKCVHMQLMLEESPVENEVIGCELTVSPQQMSGHMTDVVEVKEIGAMLQFLMTNRSLYCVMCHWSTVDTQAEPDDVSQDGIVWEKPFIRTVANNTIQRCLSSVNQSANLTLSSCSDSSPESRELLSTRFSHYDDVDYLNDGILLGGNVSLCVPCHWIHLQNRTDFNANSTVEFDGKEYARPFYYELGSNSLIICTEPKQEVADSWSILGAVCLRVGDAIVSVVTISISIACLMVMVVVYAVLPVLRNVPGYIVLSDVVALLLAFVFYLLRQPATSNPAACYFMSFMSHYLFLAAYFWSFIFGVEILRTLNTNNVVNQQSTKKFIKYSIAGWSVPLLPVVIALVMDNINGVDPSIQPQYGQPICWFTSQYGLYLYFLIPMAAMFCANLVGYIAIVVTLSILVCKTKGAKARHKEKLILSLKLVFACGLLWVFGILSAAYRNTEALTCIFLFLNSLHGVVLLLTFLTSKAVCSSFKTSRLSYILPPPTKSTSSGRSASSSAYSKKS